MGEVDWQACRLSELGFVGRGKSKNRPRNDPKLYGGAYPFIQTGDIKQAGLYISSFSQTYNEIGLAQSKLWDPGTLCITIAANIAETAILGMRACFPDSIVGFVPDPRKADVRFIKYYIDTIRLQMQSISRGTTQDNLSLDKLLSFKILTPPLDEQKRIADILSAYDDLIENNTRRIRILEKMAQAIYREWFVNFRFPGHENIRMVDSEKGSIPEGWEWRKLGDAISLDYGKSLKAEARVFGPYPVFGSSGIVGYHNNNLVKGPGIIVGRKGNVGSVFWSAVDFFPIDTVFYVISTLPLYFVYFDLKNRRFINNDAAVPGLNRNQALLMDFILPPKDLIHRFRGVIEPIFTLIYVLQSSLNNLTNQRDLLLPHLLSGD